MRKILFLVLDGMGDRSMPELGHLTPLEAASTPNMDALAATGAQGTLSTIGTGVAPESAAAVMSLLGYDVNTLYTGRGPLEADGAGIEVAPGDLAWRVSFATVDGDGRVVDRRAGRSLLTEDAGELVAALQRGIHLDGATFQLVHTGGHRASLVIRAIGEPLSGEVDNSDPGYHRAGRFSVPSTDGAREIPVVVPLRDGEAQRRSAGLTNDFVAQSTRVLAAHPVNQRRNADGYPPANRLLVRDAGDRLPALEHLDVVFGRRFAALVDLPVERGLTRLAGMHQVPLERATGAMEHDFARLADHAVEALDAFDGVYLQVKAPDVASHLGDHRRKTDALTMVDESLVGRIADRVDLSSLTTCITADHATPCALGEHSADPVPVLVSGGIEPDGAGSFGEVNAFRGALGRMTGPELMPRLVAVSAA
jgi:2,3-bisphosphoglycerate-independent phosphoglycerate mutase